MKNAIKHTEHEAMQLRKFPLRLRIDGEHINATQPKNVISTPNAKDYRQNNTALVIIWPIDESGKPEAIYNTRLIKFPKWQVSVSKFVAELYARGIILDLVNWSIWGKVWFDKERMYNPPAKMPYAWIDAPLPQNLRGLGEPSTW